MAEAVSEAAFGPPPPPAAPPGADAGPGVSLQLFYLNRFGLDLDLDVPLAAASARCHLDITFIAFFIADLALFHELLIAYGIGIRSWGPALACKTTFGKRRRMHQSCQQTPNNLGENASSRHVVSVAASTPNHSGTFCGPQVLGFPIWSRIGKVTTAFAMVVPLFSILRFL